MNLKGKRVLVTGGSGFLGRVICEKLRDRGANVQAPASFEYDLTDYTQALDCMTNLKPEVVIHSAALYGGLGINMKIPGRIYYYNLILGAHVVEASRECGTVEKFVGVGSACSYPGYIDGQLVEDMLWDGPVHESVRCYGITKKLLQIQCEAYAKQYGFNGIHLILANLYGPWDSYNPERSHVVAALIRKFVEAEMHGENTVTMWGTGVAVREFLFVRDAAEAIVLATEKYDHTDPVNIGVGVGTSIKELVEKIVNVSDYQGRIYWDTSKPDGQAAKVFSIDKMVNVLDWKPPTDLHEGLNITIDWFQENYEKAIERW